MKLAAAVCLAVLIACAGCSASEPPKTGDTAPASTASKTQTPSATAPSPTAAKAAPPAATPTPAASPTPAAKPTPTPAATATPTVVAKAAPAPTGNLLIEITNPKSPAIRVGGKEVPAEELQKLLVDFRQSAKPGKDHQVVIRADPDVAYDRVAQVMLAAGKADIPGWWIQIDLGEEGKAPAAVSSTPTSGMMFPVRSTSAAATAARPAAPAATSSASPAASAKAAPAKGFLVELVNPGNPVVRVDGKEVNYPILVTLLTTYAKSLPQGSEPKVVVRADPDMPFEKIAMVMLACGNAGISNMALNDFPVRFPDGNGLRPDPNRLPLKRIDVELLDDSQNGDRIMIILSNGQELPDINALRRKLTETWASGISPNSAVLLKPTMAAQCKHVLLAARAATDAGFTAIHFAVPYE